MNPDDNIENSDKILVESNILSFDGYYGTDKFLRLNEETRKAITQELSDGSDRHFQSAVEMGIISVRN